MLINEPAATERALGALPFVMPPPMTGVLSLINPLQRYCMVADDFGDLQVISSLAWASALYFANGYPRDQYFFL